MTDQKTTTESQVSKRDKPRQCFICGESNENVLEDHHKIPRRYDGSDKDENIVTLCSNCHQAVEKIYNPQFWNELGVYQTWDPNSPTVTYNLWTAKTLAKSLEGKMESHRYYIEEHCDYLDIELADPSEVETKEQAYQLGRYQAWVQLREELLFQQPDDRVFGDEILDREPQEFKSE